MTLAWTEMHRHISWSLLTYSRMRLKIGLETCVASAFMMVHQYFLVKHSSPHSLFIILVTSLFSSCKMNENVRTMQQIYSELLHCCRDASNKIKHNRLVEHLGRDNFDDCVITPQELLEINMCELDLLEANGFNMNIDLPFKHVDENVKPYIKDFPPEIVGKLKNGLAMNICMLLCFQKTADLPACVLAVAATQIAFNNVCRIPNETEEWIRRIESENNPEMINQAREFIIAKKNKDAQRRESK